jgi:hypothetical protein
MPGFMKKENILLNHTRWFEFINTYNMKEQFLYENIKTMKYQNSK